MRERIIVKAVSRESKLIYEARYLWRGDALARGCGGQSSRGARGGGGGQEGKAGAEVATPSMPARTGAIAWPRASLEGAREHEDEDLATSALRRNPHKGPARKTQRARKPHDAAEALDAR